MSLINEVLRKLDQRPPSPTGRAQAPPNLRAVSRGHWHPSGWVVSLAAVVFLAGAGAGVAGWWLWSGADRAPGEGAPTNQESADPGAGESNRTIAGVSATTDPQAQADAGAGESAKPSESELAIELPPMSDGGARVEAAPPQQSERPGALPPAPAGEGTALKHPAPGRLKVALVPPEERTLRGEGRTGQTGAEPEPNASVSSPGSQESVQVEVPRSWQQRQRAAQLARSGYQALGEQRYRTAVDQLSEAQRLAPARTDIINNLALAQWQVGARQEAVSTLTQGLRNHLDDPRMARNLAHFLLRAGDEVRRQEGAEVLTKALQRQDRLALFALVGSLYRDMGHPGEAIGIYRTGLARKGAHWRLLVGLGLALEGDGQPAKAAQVYRRALDSLPQDQGGVRKSLNARLEGLGADGGN